MFDKTIKLTPAIYDYVLGHGSSFVSDRIAEGLTRETESKYGYLSEKQIPPDVGALLTVLTRLSGAKRAVEVGTFTGYSALCIARGMPNDGQLICCDISQEWASLGQAYWRKAGVDERIHLRIGPAIETLRELPQTEHLDLAFIDADKPNYVAYWNELLPRIRAGGLLIVDNVLKRGDVVERPTADEHVIGITMFNEHIAADSRVDYAMLTVGDGITIAIKKYY